MAVRDVPYKVCDKGRREHLATKTRNFLWFGVRYEIDVCDQHDAQLKGALDEWIEAATPLTQSLGNVSPLSRGAAYASTEAAPAAVTNVNGPEKDWVFTEHALERCQERRIDPEAVRRVAQWPAWSGPSTKGEQFEERFNDDLLVVVIPAEKRIITVAPRHRERMLVANS